MKHTLKVPGQEEIVFRSVSSPALLTRPSSCRAPSLSLVWFGLYGSPGHVSPLRAMTNVNPAGTQQAVAKIRYLSSNLRRENVTWHFSQKELV